MRCAFALIHALGSGLAPAATARAQPIYDLPGFDVSVVGPSFCGDPIDPGSGLKVSDALAVLKASIGLFACDLCRCDVDGMGSILASDALLVLRASVGIRIFRRCPACARIEPAEL